MRLVATDAVNPKLWDERELDFGEVLEAWTDLGRLLKLVVIPHREKGIAVLRTAFEPDEDEVKLYDNNI